MWRRSSFPFALLYSAFALSSADAQTVIDSVFQPGGTGLYGDAQNWSPQEVPSNSPEKSYNVSVTGSLRMNVDATISNLNLASTTLISEGYSLTVTASTAEGGSGPSSFSMNSTERGAAMLSLGAYSGFSAGALTGSFSMNAYGGATGFASIQFNGANVTALKGAHVGLTGPLTRMIDEAGNDALRNLALIDATSQLWLHGRHFSTAASFTNDGELSISDGSFIINGSLTNFDTGTRTLTSGRYSVGDGGRAGQAPSFIRFNGADIVRNAAHIGIFGAATKIVDEAGRDALRNFTHNTATGSFSLGNADFRTIGDFTNDGTLAVGDGTFRVTGRLTNFDPATKTLTGGIYKIGGYQAGTLAFPGADIVRNAASLSLESRDSFTDESGNNALRNLAYNEAGANFLAPHGFTAAGDFTNAGTLSVVAASGPDPTHSFTVPAGRKYVQTGGETLLGAGTFNGDMEITGGTLTAYSNFFSGTARIVGNVNLGTAAFRPLGLHVDGSIQMSSGSRFRLPAVNQDYSGGEQGLTVTGTVALNGTIEINDPGRFPSPSTGGIAVISSNGLTGQFSNAPHGARVPTTDGRGTYRVTYNAGEVFVSGYERSVPPAQLLNISSRANVRPGNEAAIGGFIVFGPAKKVIVRGIGPSLANASVEGALENPTLELHDSRGTIVATNDNWADTQRSEIEQSGVAPSDEREAAIVASLPSGAYTAVLRGANATAGVGLVEIYDLGSENSGKLGNISTRAFVDADNLLIGGLIAGGRGPGDAELTVRAIGPSLKHKGITNYLRDPMLEVRDKNGATVAANDDFYSPEGNSATVAPGLAPFEEQDAATGLIVPPGDYTVIVRAKTGQSGIALVEIYDLNR